MSILSLGALNLGIHAIWYLIPELFKKFAIALNLGWLASDDIPSPAVKSSNLTKAIFPLEVFSEELFCILLWGAFKILIVLFSNV